MEFYKDQGLMDPKLSLSFWNRTKKDIVLVVAIESMLREPDQVYNTILFDGNGSQILFSGFSPGEGEEADGLFDLVQDCGFLNHLKPEKVKVQIAIGKKIRFVKSLTQRIISYEKNSE